MIKVIGISAITGMVVCYIIAFSTCEYASRQGIKQPHKEGYYYSMFLTCLTTFGFLIPGVIILLLTVLYFMGE